MSLFIDVRGAGASSVVVLHGIPSDVGWAEQLVSALATTSRVLIPHLPGYGRTPARAAFDWPAMQHELASSLRGFSVQRPVLIGFSGGAWRALELASELGARSVVCLSGIAALGAADRDGFRQFAQALRSGVDLRPLAGPRFLARRAADPAAVSVVQGWLEGVAPMALAAELDALAGQPDLLPQVGALRCPVLVRNGSADLVCPPSSAQALAHAAMNAHLELVEGAGHALLVEDADETVASVMRFVGASA